MTDVDKLVAAIEKLVGITAIGIFCNAALLICVVFLIGGKVK